MVIFSIIFRFFYSQLSDRHYLIVVSLSVWYGGYADSCGCCCEDEFGYCRMFFVGAGHDCTN